MKAILCFGDSITFGRGEQPCQSWVGRLKNYFEKLGPSNGVYNLGVPGHTSTDLLKRIDAEALGRIRMTRPTNTYLVLIAIGTNDCKWDGMPKENNPRMSLEQFEQNIKDLIQKTKNMHAKVAFLGLPPVDEEKTLPFEETSFKNKRVEQFNDVIKIKCKDQQILFLDFYSLMKKENYQEMLYDGLHPNAKGYDFMFEHVKEFIEKNKLI